MSFSDSTPAASEPEYLGTTPTSEQRPRRRLPLVGLAAVGVVGAVAAGGWAALNLMATGAQPASVVPSDAVAYVSLDLDPSAAQKVEAIRIIEKFPALDEELGLDAQDDLRRWAFEEMRPDTCPALDYEADVAPWIGDRVAIAVLPGRDGAAEPVPMVALQVTDAEAAAEGLDALAGCADPAGDTAGGEVGYAFADGYVVLAETTGTAEQIAVAASDAALADDATFLRWTEEAGDPGIAMAYVAPEAVTVMAAAAGTMPEEYADPGSGLVPGLGFGGPDTEQLEKIAEDFEGLASVLRFADGAVEVELAGGWLPEDFESPDGQSTGIGALPATTGAALGFSVPDGWAEDMMESLGQLAGGMPVDDMLAEAEAATGLDLPEDVETLLGDGLSIALDSSLDASAFESGDPAAVPVGVRVSGDPTEILPVVDKIRAAWGPGSEAMVVESGDGAVAFGTDPDYVVLLSGDGGLADEDSFRGVVPDADKASAAAYVDFDAGDAWVERIVVELAGMFPGAEGDGAEIQRNMESLDAFGVSSWVDGEVVRGVLRLSTD